MVGGGLARWLVPCSPLFFVVLCLVVVPGAFSLSWAFSGVLAGGWGTDEVVGPRHTFFSLFFPQDFLT